MNSPHNSPICSFDVRISIKLLTYIKKKMPGALVTSMKKYTKSNSEVQTCEYPLTIP